MSHWNAQVYDNSLKFVSDYGRELVGLLNPQKGERILDLGCGTGDLTIEISNAGAEVTGLDSSDNMLERARQKYPQLPFVKGEAESFSFNAPFDAVLSNAALHWINEGEQEKTLKNIFQHLKPNARFVAEMGGKGNVQKITNSIQSTISEAGYKTVDLTNVFYFPSIGEYATLMEKVGFTVEACWLFERPTHILNGKDGLKDWVSLFGIHFFQNVPNSHHADLMSKAVDKMLQVLEKDERFFADYVRLRFIAKKFNNQKTNL